MEVAQAETQHPGEHQKLQLCIQSNNDVEARGRSIIQSTCGWQNDDHCAKEMPLQFYHDFESQQLEETQIMTWSLRSQHIEDPRDIIQLLIAEVQSYPGIWNKKSLE